MEMQLKTKVKLLNSNICVLRFWLIEVDKNTHAERKQNEAFPMEVLPNKRYRIYKQCLGKPPAGPGDDQALSFFLSLRDILEKKKNPRAPELLLMPLGGTYTQSAKQMWPALPGPPLFTVHLGKGDPARPLPLTSQWLYPVVLGGT